MKSGVYCIRNRVTDKRYIGMSVNINERQKQHLDLLLNGTHYNIYLQRAFNKHGQSLFEFSKIEFVDNKHMSERERYWIKFFDTTNSEKGYNHTDGGEGGDTWTNNPNKEETTQKIIQTRKNNGKPWCSEETRKKMKKPRSEESKLNMRNNQPDRFGEKNGMFGRSGDKHPAYGMKWMSKLGNKSIKVKSVLVTEYLSEGWILGRGSFHGSLGKHWKLSEEVKEKYLDRVVIYNSKTDVEKRVKEEEKQNYLNNGWIVGQSKKHKENLNKNRGGCLGKHWKWKKNIITL